MDFSKQSSRKSFEPSSGGMGSLGCLPTLNTRTKNITTSTRRNTKEQASRRSKNPTPVLVPLTIDKSIELKPKPQTKPIATAQLLPKTKVVSQAKPIATAQLLPETKVVFSSHKRTTTSLAPETKEIDESRYLLDEPDIDYDTDFGRRRVQATTKGPAQSNPPPHPTTKDTSTGEINRRKQQIATASAALVTFVTTLFDRKSNNAVQKKAASEWCVCRGHKKEQGTVVLSVARHLKDAYSSKEAHVEIVTRLEETFKDRNICTIAHESGASLRL
jgi:hypothetical protein